jgi:hypothetical protein
MTDGNATHTKVTTFEIVRFGFAVVAFLAVWFTWGSNAGTAISKLSSAMEKLDHVEAKLNVLVRRMTRMERLAAQDKMQLYKLEKKVFGDTTPIEPWTDYPED